jgi:hypothetical protein
LGGGLTVKVETLNDYPMTAEVWIVVSQDEAGITTFAYDRVIPCKLISRERTSILLAEAGLQPFMQIRNVRDVNAELINAGGTYTVKTRVPVVNVFGFVEGMSYTLTGGN